MKLSLALMCSALGYSAANPFAPKVTKNTAKARMNAKLMRGATPIRKLEQQEDGEVDLTNYSIKFEKCQFVKQYDAEEGGGEENDSILTTKVSGFRSWLPLDPLHTSKYLCLLHRNPAAIRHLPPVSQLQLRLVQLQLR